MKHNRIIVLFVAQLFLMFLGSISKVATIICAPLSVVLAIVIAIQTKKENGVSVCTGLIWLLVLQNLMIGLGAHLGENNDGSLKIITQIPTFTILFISIYNAIKSNSLFANKSGKFFIILLSFIVFSIFVERGQILGILMNIRNMISFYFAYRLAKNLIVENEHRKLFYQNMMFCAKIVLIAGIILLLGGYELYSAIGIDEVYIAKGSTLGGGKLDNRFYTTLISTQIPRMGSLYYEPVNLAYLYAALLIQALYPLHTEKKRVNDILLCATGLILSMGKGGILIAVACIGFSILLKILRFAKRRSNIQKALLAACILTIVIAVIFSITYYQKIGASANPHFWAVIRTWQNVVAKPLGHGLGTGGNMSNLFNTGSSISDYGGEWLSTGGESALMAFLYQIGIPAVLSMFFILYYMIPRNNFCSQVISVYWFLPISLFAISILQDNTFAPQCIVLPMMLTGIASNIANSANTVSNLDLVTGKSNIYEAHISLRKGRRAVIPQ